MKIKFKLIDEQALVPERQTAGAAGFDLYTTENYSLLPGEYKVFKTGVACAIPEGYCGIIMPRSGWAVSKGLDKLAGLIDADYRGEVLVCLVNHGDSYITIKAGDRIGQMVVTPFLGESEVVEELDDTVRGEGGFGSTGGVSE